MDRKWLKIAFSLANCRFRLPISNLKRCFNAYRSALLDCRGSSRLPPIRCEKGTHARNYMKLIDKKSDFISDVYLVNYCYIDRFYWRIGPQTSEKVSIKLVGVHCCVFG